MCLETIEYRINCSVCGKELITTNPEDIAHWSCLISKIMCNHKNQKSYQLVPYPYSKHVSYVTDMLCDNCLIKVVKYIQTVN